MGIFFSGASGETKAVSSDKSRSAAWGSRGHQLVWSLKNGKGEVHVFYERTVGYQKSSEVVEIPKSMTVEQFLDHMIQKYGNKFGQHVYAEGTLDGKRFKTPNIYLNKRRIQWVQDFPKGIETIVKDGDEFWFGLIVGGGNT